MNAIFENYLDTVCRHLKPLPASERADIVKEIESSILEMENDGLSDEQILERLGSPKALAKAYLGDMIARGKGFSINRFLTICAFYSVVGLSGVVVIPTLGIIAPAFIAGGAIAPILGVYKLISEIFGLHLPLAQYINSMSIDGVPIFSPTVGFVCTVLMGIALFLLGYGAWRLLLYYIKKVSSTKKELSL